MRSEKMKAKYLNRYLWKRFFRKLAGWYLATSLRINFFTDEFYGFWSNQHFPVTTSRSYTKCLKSTCEIVIVYAGRNHKILTQVFLHYVNFAKFSRELLSRTPPGNHFWHDVFFSFFPDQWGLRPKNNKSGGVMLH